MANHLNLDLSGGMNVAKAPLTLSDNECELALNYNLDRYGALTKRTGYTILGSQIVDNMSIRTLYAYGSEKSTLVASINETGGSTQAIYRYDGSSWTAKVTGLNTSYNVHFAEFVDRIFYVNGADDMKSSANGTSLGTWAYTSCPPSTDAFRPKYIAVFEDRVYAASTGSTGEGARLFWSSLPSGNAISWDITNDWADIDPDQMEEIVGLEKNGNRLLIFKKRALYRWQFGAVEADRVIGVGAFSQECIVTNYEVGITFFFGPHGVYAYSLGEGRPKLISRPIQRILDTRGNTTWDDCVMTCDKDNVYITGISSFTLDGRTITNPWLVYNIPLDAWTVYSTGDLAKSVTTRFDSTRNLALVMGSSDGEVFTFSVPSSTEYPTDNGKSIETDFISREYLLNIPKQARVERIDVISLIRNRTQIFFDTDRCNEWAPLGELEGRITELKTKKPRCNTLRIRATSNNRDQHILEGYNIEYEPIEYEDQKAYGRKAEQHR